MSAKTKQSQPEQEKDASKSLVSSYFKKHKEDHLNFDETVSWKASTGSLLFDAELGGGFSAGGIKVAGASFAGKTNCVLTCVKNALDTVENSKGLWFKAEGRLDQEVMDRCGAKFVFDPEEWEVGTLLVVESNVYEFIINLINDLVKNNPNQFRYIMAIDSADALIRRDDEKKEAEEGEKVGAGGLLMSLMFKKAGLVLNKKGHCLFILAQLRAKVETNQYAPKDQNKSVGGGGSNALTHGVNQVWNFQGRTKGRNIQDGDKVIGHKCAIILSKGVKERFDVLVEYPVKHGQTNGHSVWTEMEIIDLLLSWEFFTKSGAWFTVEPELLSYIRQLGFEFPEKIQGIASIYALLEGNKELTNHLKKFVEEHILGQ